VSSDHKRSEHRVAIVTGASRGIGRAIALELAEEGFAVVVNYHRNREPAEAVVRQIAEQGGQAVAVQADVANLNDHGKLIDAAVTHWQRLDLLVNNAGITSPGRHDVLETTADGWDLVLDTNLKGPFFLAQLAAKTMLQLHASGGTQGGYLINISSISAYAASLNRPDYCIAKAGMQMLTWLFAARLGDAGILVYEVCPGVISSDMTAPVREKYDALIADGLTPIRRWGEPHDVARAVRMLVQGHLAFTTGERINVDGGFHLRRL
jgi:NAD(P)-dependent dehydrogenase (short-subunit alcohol dehydrogenase family)